MKSVRSWNFSGPYFPAFGLNMGTYSENLCIHFECGKMRTRKILNTNTFYVVCLSEESFNEESTLNIEFRSSSASIYLFKINNRNIRAMISDSTHCCGASIAEKFSYFICLFNSLFKTQLHVVIKLIYIEHQ